MSGILLPRDRTTKQRPTGFCLNPECFESSDQQRFEFPVEHDRTACPKCGADRSPMVGLLSLVHHVIRTPKGKIVGVGGLKYGLACDPGRSFIATVTNNEHGSGDISAVNCPGCLAAHQQNNTPAVSGMSLNIGR